jgi:hypothetical protein
MKNPGISAVLKDYSKLMELGADQKFVEKLDANQAKELLKGILYVSTMYADHKAEVK